MTTAVFVTPHLHPESPVRGFAATHVGALASRFDRVVVVAGSARNDLDELDATVVTPDPAVNGGGVLRIGPLLAEVIADVGKGALVIVQDDLACLVQARAVMDEVAAPLLWWCPHVASTRAATEAAKWADGLLVAGPPDPPIAGCPVFTVGAGIDLGAPSGSSAFPERPPLELIALGPTSPSRGLPVGIRAVAIARSQGIDARLRIVGPSTNFTEWNHRHELESLVSSLALSDAVRIVAACPPGRVAEMVRRAHVLVDARVDDDLSRSALEAMAAERIVLSASSAVAPLLDEASPIRLTFEPGNAAQLAEGIARLSAAWPATLQGIGASLRRVVEQHHSAELWADRVAAVRYTAASSQA